MPLVPQNGSNKRVANSLLALSTAAVLAVYAAGYVRTRSAADRFEVQAAGRRPAIPGPPSAAPPAAETASVVAPPVAVAPKRTPNKPIKKTRPAAPVAVPAVTPAAPSLAAPLPAPIAEPPVPVVEQPPAAPAAPSPAPAKPRYKDGTYLGWGTSRHGDIEASVVIKDGRIEAATIAQCLTRYSCNVIANLPPQVAQRQSPETDYVSGATQSTNAFYYAVVDALLKAK